MEHSNISTQAVSRETFSNTDKLIEKFKDDLSAYLDQLFWWNERINLVSRDVSRETVWEHIRHSLLLSQFNTFKSAKIIVDAGTGGGLPGMPLAITHPNKHFVLNDLVTKKCLAMKQMAKKLKLKNLGIVDGSIKDFAHDEEFLLISKHAFKINDLYEMTSSLPWSEMIFYKGSDFKDELTGIPDQLNITTHELSGISEFYQGKAIVVISR